MATWDETIALYEGLLPDAKAQVEAQRQIEIDALNKQREYQIGLLKNQLEDSAQQAYITREMNRKDLPAYLAQQGLTGGITETAANNLLRDYRNAINAGNKTYSTNVNELENTYATNVADTNTTYAQMLMDAMANQRAEALQRALYAAQYGDMAASSSGTGGGIVPNNTAPTPLSQRNDYIYSNTGTKGAVVTNPSAFLKGATTPSAYKKTSTEKARSSWYNPNTYKVNNAVTGKYF